MGGRSFALRDRRNQGPLRLSVAFAPAGSTLGGVKSQLKGPPPRSVRGRLARLGRGNQGQEESRVAPGPPNMPLGGVGRQLKRARPRGPEDVYLSPAPLTLLPQVSNKEGRRDHGRGNL